MKNLYLYLLLAAGLLSTNAKAQIKLNHLGGGVSYWERSYSGDSENAFLTGYEYDRDFTVGAAMPYLTAELGLFENFGIDARVGVWSADFNEGARFGQGTTIEETIKQTIIPVSGGIVVRWGNMLRDRLDIVTGIGVNRYFIQNRVRRRAFGENPVSVNERFSGNNYGGYLRAGLELKITQQLAVGLEGRYNTGGYKQEYQPLNSDVPIKYDVSVQGTEYGVTFLYRFDYD